VAAAEVYVAGTRTFAAEVIDFAQDAGLEVAGLLEPYDRDRVATTIHDRPVSWLDDGPSGDSRLVLVGTGEIARRKVVGSLLEAGWQIVTLVHPRAHVAPSAVVGQGVILSPGVVIGARSRVGDYAVLGRGALIGHHTELGPFCTLGPGANVAGNVHIEPDVFIGMGALVRDHVRVGASAVIAMGSVVVRDVSEKAAVRGLPAASYP
jgi:sugar O-acyltransferase (sialic acid O-acetyltransferase NeuD family)